MWRGGPSVSTIVSLEETTPDGTTGDKRGQMMQANGEDPLRDPAFQLFMCLAMIQYGHLRVDCTYSQQNFQP